MPRPLHPRNFQSISGSTIKVNYHNGSSAVTGYIVKQLGTKKFRVTTNGTDKFDVEFAQTTGAAETLVAGTCTIVVAPFGGDLEYVKKITSRKLVTTDGNVYKWGYTVPTAAGVCRPLTNGDDITPTAFSFVDETDATISTVYTSANVTLAGLTAPTAITISGSGATYSINGAAFTAAAGWVVNGDVIRARVTSSGSAATAVSAIVTVGGVSDTYTVTTAA